MPVRRWRQNLPAPPLHAARSAQRADPTQYPRVSRLLAWPRDDLVCETAEVERHAWPINA